MGAGKTTVGRLLGRRHGVEFLDLDDMLDVGSPFDEVAFRRSERDAFRARVAFDGILSLGGGTLLDPTSAGLAWTFRKVVVLRPPNAVAVTRSDGKPLAASAADLLRERAASYRQGFSIIRFDADATPDDVADAVERLLVREG